jgi:hypothetical protein
MVIANNSPIEATDLNEVFSDGAAPTPSGNGLTLGVDDQKNKANGYSIMRFRTSEVVNVAGSGTTSSTHIHRFTCPDDFDIKVAGLTVFITPFGSTPPPPVPPAPPFTVKFTAQIQGAITDLENDLPIDEVLFLTEPVSNTEGQKYVQLELPPFGAPSTTLINSARYGAYDSVGPSSGSLENRPVNTLLKNVLYEVIMKREGQYAVAEDMTMVDFYIMYKVKLRRN